MADVRFLQVLNELSDLHQQKSADYGVDHDPYANVRASDGWGVEPWVGACVRLTDKVVRLQSYVTTGHLANEGVEDSLIDLAAYAVIALVLYREQTDGTPY